MEALYLHSVVTCSSETSQRWPDCRPLSLPHHGRTCPPGKKTTPSVFHSSTFKTGATAGGACGGPGRACRLNCGFCTSQTCALLLVLFAGLNLVCLGKRATGERFSRFCLFLLLSSPWKKLKQWFLWCFPQCSGSTLGSMLRNDHWQCLISSQCWLYCKASESPSCTVFLV